MVTTAVPADLAGEFELRRAPSRVALVRSGFGPAFEALGLFASASPVANARSPAGGRGGAWVADDGEGGHVVVRPGRRGGWPGRLIRSRYFLGDRFLSELILTERLRRRGAPVPEPLAAVRAERGVGYETWLVSRKIPGVAPVAEVLRGASADEIPVVLRAMGRAVAGLHQAGGDHADLNAWNLLVEGRSTADRDAYVIDLDRGRLRPGPLDPKRAAANLARLKRSLRKCGLEGALAAWPAFQRGYDGVPGDSSPTAGAAS